MSTFQLTYKLSAYEGPLDLLYQLIQTHKIDICDIPIAELAEQYIDFLNRAEDRDMDSMSEFALLAATLLEIKSKMLLPKQIAEEEPDPRKELVDKLLEYQRVKLAAELLESINVNGSEVFFRKIDSKLIKSLKTTETIDDILEGVTVISLYEIFKSVMGRRELKIDKIRSSFKSVSKDLFTVEEKIQYIRELLEITPLLSFMKILEICETKSEMVVTFLALLELVKTKEASVIQRRAFDDIEIRMVQNEYK